MSGIDPTATTSSLTTLEMRTAITPQERVVLSETAQAALDRISQMQDGFEDTGRLVAQHEGEVNATSSDAPSLSDMVDRVTAHLESSVRVQEQIARFTVASSVSSQFGRNLNMFLRGQ